MHCYLKSVLSFSDSIPFKKPKPIINVLDIVQCEPIAVVS